MKTRVSRGEILHEDLESQMESLIRELYISRANICLQIVGKVRDQFSERIDSYIDNVNKQCVEEFYRNADNEISYE